MHSTTDVINVLSVDVEDYFHGNAFASIDRSVWNKMENRVVVNTHTILELFSQQNVFATFFVLGWCAEKYPNLIKEIHDAGHEVACHGYGHVPITEQKPDEFKDDVRHACGLIEDIVGQKVFGYRAPTFSVTRKTLWAIDILQQLGLRYDSSIFPIYHDRYGIPDYSQKPHEICPGFHELPLSTVSVGRMRLPVGGGGYLRLYPLAVTKWAFKTLNRRGQPIVAYFHPHEIDDKSPKPPGLASRLRRGLHTGNMKVKIQRLLEQFRFAPAKEVLGL